MVATHWPGYNEGVDSVGGVADRADWRVARTIFVTDDEVTAQSYGREASTSPIGLLRAHAAQAVDRWTHRSPEIRPGTAR